MARERIIVGAGQCGMKLGYKYLLEIKYERDFIALSTSTEDSVGIPKEYVKQIAVEGSGKKFSVGSQIWEENTEEMAEALDFYDKDVIYFASAAGGSGSSSVRHACDLLLEQGNRVFLVLVLPFKYEILPFKPNAIQTISNLLDGRYADNVSIMMFDNDKLSKQYNTVENEVTLTDLEKMNHHIVSSTSIVIDLVSRYHHPEMFSPFTIDELEHDSVVFSGGFIAYDIKRFEESPGNVKFEYGKLKEAKNVVIAKAVSLKESDYSLENGQGPFLNVVKKISSRAKNARVMYGIIRTDKIDNGSYIIIANNMDITNYITKLKEKVEGNVEGYLGREAREKMLTRGESKKFDI
jgi:hypothetical protein